MLREPQHDISNTNGFIERLICSGVMLRLSKHLMFRKRATLNKYLIKKEYQNLTFKKHLTF